MNRDYELTEDADRDVFEISVYIARNNYAAAERFLDTLYEKFQLLADSPTIGRRREELAHGLRSFPTGSYAIYYRETERGIHVVRVLHGARDLDAIFGSEEADT